MRELPSALNWITFGYGDKSDQLVYRKLKISILYRDSQFHVLKSIFFIISSGVRVCAILIEFIHLVYCIHLFGVFVDFTFSLLVRCGILYRTN